MAIFLTLPAPAPAAAHAPYVSCRDDAAKYARRSDELQKILAADQADRPNDTLRPLAQVRDRRRRERVGAIFGEGCFKTARDFAAAAMVFQHGDQPEHFLQTFLWAKRAFELGDPSQKKIMAWGIDRYLVKLGQKQLFGSQYLKHSPENPRSCWCLEQTESSFPDQRRLEFTEHTYAQQIASLKVLNSGAECPLAECSDALAPSPAGTVPGFW